jgi:hypothetical protein
MFRVCRQQSSPFPRSTCHFIFQKQYYSLAAQVSSRSAQPRRDFAGVRLLENSWLQLKPTIANVVCSARVTGMDRQEGYWAPPEKLTSVKLIDTAQALQAAVQLLPICDACGIDAGTHPVQPSFEIICLPGYLSFPIDKQNIILSHHVSTRVGFVPTLPRNYAYSTN